MISFSPCKINLGLYITAKRQDGFHDIETIFLQIPFNDIIELIKNENGLQNELTFSQSGLNIPGDTDNNICIKAHQLILKKTGFLPALKLHLHKIIPMGAGLGGGSANGSNVLKLINNLCNLNLTKVELQKMSLELGSDCPLFFEQKAVIGKGRGEILQPISLNLSSYQILLVNPNIHIPTPWAFKQIVPQATSINWLSISEKNIDEWKLLLTNDFEKGVFIEYPYLKNIKDNLYLMGAVYASLSGSGSTFFGIFEKEDEIKIPLFFENYFTKIISL